MLDNILARSDVRCNQRTRSVDIKSLVIAGLHHASGKVEWESMGEDFLEPGGAREDRSPGGESTVNTDVHTELAEQFLFFVGGL